MILLSALVSSYVESALQKAFGRTDIIPEVTQSTQPQFGHYQCNNPLKLAKELKQSPRQIAEAIVREIEINNVIAKVEIAGPGFINLFLSPQFLASEMEKVIADPKLGGAYPSSKQKMIVEFSSPNTAKELHVGHLRSTIIGDCLARLFEFLGHTVVRLNHVGDWGTQFGMLIAYIQKYVPDVFLGQKEVDLSQLMGWYRAAKKEFDQDSDFKKKAQLEVVKLQGGNEASLAAWNMICAISRHGYQEIYDLLDVKIQERGESFYNPFLPGVVADLEKRGLVTVSEGAKCIYLDGFIGQNGKPLPMIIQKSDGGYNYDTTDMAALRHRIEVEKADRIIYVVDAGQSLHFQMLFQVAEKAGYLDPTQVTVEHAAFGVVLGADGKKFKTRSGETEKLIDLLTEAIQQAEEILRQKGKEDSEESLKETAKVLGIDAVKYADLSCHRIKDYAFSYERMLRFEGNTAPFLLYAYVRARSILNKVKPTKMATVALTHPTEIALALYLRQFGEALAIAAQDLTPHRICDYLYGLAEQFHAFFRDCRVEGDPQEASRRLLCEATAQILEQGLHILGLKTVAKM